MTNPNILTKEDLQEILGVKREGNLERHLTENGIEYFHGKNGIWTTLQLINAARGLTSGETHRFDIAI